MKLLDVCLVMDRHDFCHTVKNHLSNILKTNLQYRKAFSINQKIRRPSRTRRVNFQSLLQVCLTTHHIVAVNSEAIISHLPTENSTVIPSFLVALFGCIDLVKNKPFLQSSVKIIRGLINTWRDYKTLTLLDSPNIAVSSKSPIYMAMLQELMCRNRDKDSTKIPTEDEGTQEIRQTKELQSWLNSRGTKAKMTPWIETK